MAIRKVCDCGSFETDVFSVNEKIEVIQGREVSVAEINYICNDCGAMDMESHFLYKNKIKKKGSRQKR